MSKDDSVLQISICNRIVLGQKASGALEDIRAERTSSRDVRRLKGCHESAPLYNWLCVLILSHLCHGLFVSAETKARCGARICQAASKTGHGYHSKLDHRLCWPVTYMEHCQRGRQYHCAQVKTLSRLPLSAWSVCQRCIRTI